MAEKKQDYGTGYLYAEDLLSGGRFRTATVEISEVHHPGTLKAANGKTIDKWVIGFKGKSKRLCLAKTNAAIIHIITGDAPGETWIGKNITLQARVVNAFGDKTLCLRVIPPQGAMLRKTLYERLGSEATYTPTSQPTQQQQQPTNEVTDDDLERALSN